MVDIKTDDGVADAYLSRPDDEQRHPGVLFIMDAYGLRPWIDEMAERIAAAHPDRSRDSTAARSRPMHRTARTDRPTGSGRRCTSGTPTMIRA